MSKFLQTLLLAAAVRAGAQQAPPALPARHDIVRGRVASDSGVPIRGADVIITQTSDAATQAVQTDAGGAYRTDWPQGTGDYAVSVTAAGYKRFVGHAVRGADSVIVLDVHLARAAQQLATVVSQ